MDLTNPPLWFLVLLGITVYSVINGIVLGYQLQHSGFLHFKINRLGMLCKIAVIKSAISAFILLGLQAVFLVYACRVELLALKCFSYDCCPVAINETRLLAQTSLGVVIVFGVIKMIIQRFMIQEAYHLDDRVLWRMLFVSNAVACTAQYLAIYPWL